MNDEDPHFHIARQAALAWASTHRDETGHAAWVQCRGWHDFSVMCRECIVMAED